MLQLELNQESLKLLNLYSLGEACDLDGIGASESQTCSNQPSYLWTSSGCGSHYSMPRTSFQRSEHLFFIPACASATNQSQYNAQWWKILLFIKLLQCSGCLNPRSRNVVNPTFAPALTKLYCDRHGPEWKPNVLDLKWPKTTLKHFVRCGSFYSVMSFKYPSKWPNRLISCIQWPCKPCPHLQG